jgi:hypothetical protein
LNIASEKKPLVSDELILHAQLSQQLQKRQGLENSKQFLKPNS